MATDRQTPCLYYLGHDICFKVKKGKPLVVNCQNCYDYKSKVGKTDKKN